MTKNEFDRQLFSLIMTQTFDKHGTQTKIISEDIFIHEFGEPAKSISEEERLQQHLISLSPLNLEKPKEQLKVVLEKYICVQECFSKLNEEAYSNLDLIFYTFSEGGHGRECLDSPKELEEFISYINKANNKTRLLHYARGVFHNHIPAYSLV
ncbi:hypothetical protein [Legionella fairfieldensis]|uniref:hypothetical protein n=1 Tax=Legionella fairfieldensis TaxID=45064 RepID=UPI00048C501C|nr:hypothetical protein [Legionella fairfieldensis]